MAEKQHKGLVARWLEGKERSEEYARSTLPTSRWALFWDIFKGRFGKLMLTNLLMLLTILPLLAVIIFRYLSLTVQGTNAVFGAGLMVGADLQEGLSAPDITEAVLKAGLVVNATSSSTLRFLPPLICEESHGREAAETLASVL